MLYDHAIFAQSAAVGASRLESDRRSQLDDHLVGYRGCAHFATALIPMTLMPLMGSSPLKSLPNLTPTHHIPVHGRISHRSGHGEMEFA